MNVLMMTLMIVGFFNRLRAMSVRKTKTERDKNSPTNRQHARKDCVGDTGDAATMP